MAKPQSQLRIAYDNGATVQVNSTVTRETLKTLVQTFFRSGEPAFIPIVSREQLPNGAYTEVKSEWVLLPGKIIFFDIRDFPSDSDIMIAPAGVLREQRH